MPILNLHRHILRQLIDNKTGVHACPTCLKIAGFKPEDLMDGVQIALKDKFFSFNRGRILALDYQNKF